MISRPARSFFRAVLASVMKSLVLRPPASGSSFSRVSRNASGARARPRYRDWCSRSPTCDGALPSSPSPRTRSAMCSPCWARRCLRSKSCPGQPDLRRKPASAIARSTRRLAVRESFTVRRSSAGVATGRISSIVLGLPPVYRMAFLPARGEAVGFAGRFIWNLTQIVLVRRGRCRPRLHRRGCREATVPRPALRMGLHRTRRHHGRVGDEHFAGLTIDGPCVPSQAQGEPSVVYGD